MTNPISSSSPAPSGGFINRDNRSERIAQIAIAILVVAAIAFVAAALFTASEFFIPALAIGVIALCLIPVAVGGKMIVFSERPHPRPVYYGYQAPAAPVFVNVRPAEVRYAADYRPVPVAGRRRDITPPLRTINDIRNDRR